MDKQLNNLSCISCNSSDAMTVYYPEEGDINAFCFSCETSFGKKSLESEGDFSPDNKKLKPKVKKEPISKEAIRTIMKSSKPKADNFRGIDDSTLAFYKVRTSFKENGEASKRYYPVTEDGVASAYKVRIVNPKKFAFIGNGGKHSDLFGQRHFKDSSSRKRLLITGGEEDAMAASMMLWNHKVSKGKSEYGRDPVVSGITGEGNTVHCIKTNYKFVDSFDQIILCLDNDEAGRAATQACAEILPKGKVYILHMNESDPNDYLKKGKSKEFISAFFDARKYIPAGIAASCDIDCELEQELLLPKLTLPPFMSKIQSMTAGGIPQKKIINIAAENGIGKTTIVNEIIWHWIFKCPHTVGILSTELDKAQYGLAMLSRHIGRKIQLIEDGEEAVKLLRSESTQKARRELFFKDGGQPRFYLVDDRGASIDAVKGIIEEMIVSMGCQVVVIDVLQDLIGSLTYEQQSMFMDWEKMMKKKYPVIFVNVCHVRGSSGDSKGPRFLLEDDIHGTTSIPKSADITWMATRDKYAEDDIERNTTYLTQPKCRWTGHTGKAGELFYDNKAHTFWDKDVYMSNIKVEI